MGRRALRKIDPALDLADYLTTPETLPDPWDAVELFGRQAPLEVEIGSGKGLFLAGAAASRPERNFLGIEITLNYARFAATKLAKARLANAMLVHGDALRIFAGSLPAESVEAVHIYFPDPWWKKRHKKRRVIRDSFLKDVQRVLAPGGCFHFWTDVQEYYQTTLSILRAATQLSGPLAMPEDSASHDMDYRTHFERRKRQQGMTIYRALFRKTTNPPLS